MRLMRSLALALCVACALAAASASAASAAPKLPLSHSGRWITDAGGRVVIVHGTNMVYKLPPYYPSAVGFGSDDAAFLQRIGFNAVRVGVIWKAVEPRPGVYDDRYLAQIATTVRTLARHGVMSLLDFHQDLFNEQFQGEGAPDWAVQDGGLPNPKLGFPGNYLGNPALEHALDQFFTNATGPSGRGLQDWFASAWAHVAGRFRGSRSVLGYELLNEPFPGTQWEQCLNPSGCPAFDAELTALYRRAAAAIRAADSRTLVWYEPNVMFNNGVATHVGALGDPHAGFAFHDYCLSEPQTGSPQGCDTFDDMVFANALAQVTQTHEALMMTEWGSTTDVAYLADMVQRSDRDMVPWLEWSYCACQSPTDTGQPGIVADPSKPPTGSNLISGTLRALVEPYPQVIAGTPLSWGFTAGTKTFSFRYSTARASGHGRFARGSLTEIATPALVYGGRYAVQVSGGAIASSRGAGVVLLAACRGARTITVTVRPSGRNRDSCRLGARVGRPPGSR
ncbi:MAG TPA: cellulase family glycosylhydrolase [Solirubrobacteraceae bacterium]